MRLLVTQNLPRYSREVGKFAGEDEILQGLVVERGGKEIMVVSMDSIPKEITIKILVKGIKKYAKVVPSPAV